MTDEPEIYTTFFGERFPREPGALDGLTGERKRRVATDLMRSAWERGQDDYVISRADVEAFA